MACTVLYLISNDGQRSALQSDADDDYSRSPSDLRCLG